MKNVKPKYIRINQVKLIYGINRSFLYKKIKNNEITTALISKRIRLVSVDSIEEFLVSSID